MYGDAILNTIMTAVETIKTVILFLIFFIIPIRYLPDRFPTAKKPIQYNALFIMNGVGISLVTFLSINAAMASPSISHLFSLDMK